MRIDPGLLEQIVAHAREEAPNECCGLVAVRDGRAVEVHRAENVHASPLRFEFDPKQLFELVMGIEDSGCELGAIYHSHTRSAPIPSETDVKFAAFWPGVEWLIVGLSRNGGEADVRSYVIADGRIDEVEVLPE